MGDDLKKRLRKKKERRHDLSGVYWTEDMDCQEALARIEELEAKLDWVIVERDETFALMLDRAQTAEAKLAKSVEALREAIYLLDPDEEDIARGAGLYRIVETYKELTGGKDG